MKTMNKYLTIQALFACMCIPGSALAEYVATTNDDTLHRIDPIKASDTGDDQSLKPLYRTLTTPPVSGETFVCFATNVSDYPATIKQVTIYDSLGPLTGSNYNRNNIVDYCPHDDYINELVLQPHETCAVTGNIPVNRADEETTAAHCVIRFKDENVNVKGAMEAASMVLYYNSNGINSGGHWAKMRVDAVE